MKLWDIVRSVGGGIIKNVVPGGGLIVDVVNELLPSDQQLGTDATGTDIDQAVAGLPAAARAKLMEREFDIDIKQIEESNSTLRTMLESDAKNPHTTRPYIAKHGFHVLGVTILLVVLLWSYGVAIANNLLVKTIQDGWPFVLAVNAPLVTLLYAYFGILKAEHRDRLSAADVKPRPLSGIAGIISNLVKK